MRVLGVHIVAQHFQHARFFTKVIVDRANILRVGIQARFNVQQQNLVQLRHRFSSPVVAAHQLFAGSAVGFGAVVFVIE